MNGSVRRVLIVQDSAEVMRQEHADIASYLRDDVFSELSRLGLVIEVSFVAGSGAERAVLGLNDSDYDLVVFASNAIIRRDGLIYEHFDRDERWLRRFLRSGRSMVIFHQGFAGTDVPVKSLSFAGAGSWVERSLLTHADAAPPEITIERSSVLLNYPASVDLRQLQEGTDGLLPSGFPLFYTAVRTALGERTALRSVVAAGDDHAVLATYEDRGRLVICPFAADWAKATSLLTNIFFYALQGSPRVSVVGASAGEPDEHFKFLVARLRQRYGLVEVPSRADDRTAAQEFALSCSRLILLPGEHLPDPANADELASLLARGATITTCTADGVGERAELLMGSDAVAQIRQNVEDYLAALSSSGWAQGALLHDIRDVLLASASVFPGSTPPQAHVLDQGIHERATSWLRTNDADHDRGTAALARWLAEFSAARTWASSRVTASTVTSLLTQALRTGEHDHAFQFDGSARTVTLFPRGLDGVSLSRLIRVLDAVFLIELGGWEVQLGSGFLDVLDGLLEKHHHEILELFDSPSANMAAISTVVRGSLLHAGSLPTSTARQEVLRLANSSAVRYLDDWARDTVMREDDDGEPAQATGALLVAASAEAVRQQVESRFPSGATELLSHVAGGRLNAEHLFAESRQAAEDFTRRNRLLAATMRVAELQADNERLEALARKSFDAKARGLRPAVWTGAATAWVVGVSMVVACAVLGWRAVGAISDGDSYAGLVGSLFAVIPVTVAYFAFGWRTSLLNPSKLLQWGEGAEKAAARADD